MKDLAALVETNRFLGREFLLWLWFESEVLDTNLRPSKAPACSLWIETQITLGADNDEARIKSAMPAMSPESKQALRQGKLPSQARLRAIIEDHEFSWAFKADALAVGGLKVPAVLKAQTEPDEALYERMRLVDLLEDVLQGLFDDFLRLRLGGAWQTSIVPLLQRWAAEDDVDEAEYLAKKSKALKRSKS